MKKNLFTQLMTAFIEGTLPVDTVLSMDAIEKRDISLALTEFAMALDDLNDQSYFEWEQMIDVGFQDLDLQELGNKLYTSGVRLKPRTLETALGVAKDRSDMVAALVFMTDDGYIVKGVSEKMLYPDEPSVGHDVYKKEEPNE